MSKIISIPVLPVVTNSVFEFRGQDFSDVRTTKIYEERDKHVSVDTDSQSSLMRPLAWSKRVAVALN